MATKPDSLPLMLLSLSQPFLANRHGLITAASVCIAVTQRTLSCDRAAASVTEVKVVKALKVGRCNIVDIWHSGVVSSLNSLLKGTTSAIESFYTLLHSYPGILGCCDVSRQGHPFICNCDVHTQRLEVTFSTGERFEYPAELLRVLSPSADSTARVSLGCLSVNHLLLEWARRRFL